MTGSPRSRHLPLLPSALSRLLPLLPLLPLARGIAAGGAKANGPQEPSCQALARDEVSGLGALSMLQLAAGGKPAAPLTSHEGPPPASGRASAGAGEPVLTVPSPTTAFAGVSLLTMQLPVSEAMRQEAAKGGFFGTDILGESLKLEPGGLAELRLAYFPQAEIGWTGTAGASERVNVPHRLLTVRMPVTVDGRHLHQIVYALTDDDIAQLTYRMGGGVPAKLANISFPVVDGALPVGQRLYADRRGLALFEVSSLRDLGPAGAEDATSLEALITRTVVEYGTDIGNTAASIGQTVSYKKHATTATIRDSRRVSLDLVLQDGLFDGIRWMFESLVPTDAWWVQADLQVTTTLVSATKKASGLKTISERGRKARMQGEVITDELIQKRKSGMTYSYNDGDVVWFNIKINAEKAAPFLPPGATLAGDEGLIWHVHWQPADPTNPYEMAGLNHFNLEYNELWVTVPVEYKGKRSILPLLMLLDDDVAQNLGQDTVGCPKKLANATYTFSAHPPVAGSLVNLEVSRRGRLVLKLSGSLQNTSDHSPVLGVNDNTDPNGSMMWMMSHQFPWNPSVDRPRYVWCRGMQRTEAQLGLEGLSVELGSGAPEPLGEWFEGSPTRGGYIRMDQDWAPSWSIPLSWNLKEQPSEAAYLEWWQRSFPVLYM